MSRRRRSWEPPVRLGVEGPQPDHLIPCCDIDLAVVNAERHRVNLVVDYKYSHASTGFTSSLDAQARLWRDGSCVPFLLAVPRWDGSSSPSFDVCAHNEAGESFLSQTLDRVDATGWFDLTEATWLQLIRHAQAY